jgi:hypothetical protein
MGKALGKIFAFAAAFSAASTLSSAVHAQAPEVGQTYWVRRVTEELGGGCGRETPRDPDSMRCVSSGRIECAELTFDGRLLWLVGAPPGAGLLRFRFGAVRTADGRWDVQNPGLTLERHGRVVELDQSCLAHMSIDESRLFSDRAACEAIRGDYSASCTGARCASERSSVEALASDAWTFEGGPPRLFVFDACEVAIEALRWRAWTVASTDYADIERTHRRFARVATAGGRLYERRGASCAPVSVSPPLASDPVHAVTFRSRWRDPEGVVSRDESRYTFEPLLTRAVSHGGRGVIEPDGPGWVSTGTYGTSLYFGDGIILLGASTFYFDRECSGPTRR